MPLLRFTIAPEERERTRAQLEAHLARELARSRLDVAVTTLASIGCAAWAALAASVSPGSTGAHALVAAWLTALAATALAAARERRCRRAEGRLGELEPRGAPRAS